MSKPNYLQPLPNIMKRGKGTVKLSPIATDLHGNGCKGMRTMLFRLDESQRLNVLLKKYIFQETKVMNAFPKPTTLKLKLLS